MAKKTPARGRPKGSPNRPVDQVAAQATRCPHCKSTEREAYYRTTVQQFGGVDASGNPFTHIVRRWTRCERCGRNRIDRFLEQRGASGIAADSPKTSTDEGSAAKK